ncbi:MAG: hypothetical protein E7497_06725 [Ruminococcus sp.]|nr:hypothetical protein [Ruminococcus sp.]
MFDRKVFYTLVSSAVVSGFIVICTLGQTLHYQKSEAKGERMVKKLPEAEYVVREYDGKLGVFRGNSNTPYRVVEYDASLLSEYDRSQLVQGISLETEAELDTYLEDIIT